MDTASLIQSYLNAVQSPNNPSAVQMVQENPGNYLQNNFFQQPAYQLLYGQNANSLNPTQRFQQDPGYQYAQDQGAQQLQRSYANKGLLDSGTMVGALQNQAQGTANQGYQQYLGQQNALFSNYQNQLANLVTAGTAANGSQAALSTGSQLSSLLANTGSGVAGTQSSAANANLSTANDLASLFGNQGVFGANAMMNTAAAQSNNMLQGAELQTQIGAANAASQSGSMNSLFGGLGKAVSNGTFG